MLLPNAPPPLLQPMCNKVMIFLYEDVRAVQLLFPLCASHETTDSMCVAKILCRLCFSDVVNTVCPDIYLRCSIISRHKVVAYPSSCGQTLLKGSAVSLASVRCSQPRNRFTVRRIHKPNRWRNVEVPRNPGHTPQSCIGGYFCFDIKFLLRNADLCAKIAVLRDLRVSRDYI